MGIAAPDDPPLDGGIESFAATISHFPDLYHDENDQWDTFWNRDETRNGTSVPPSNVTITGVLGLCDAAPGL